MVKKSNEFITIKDSTFKCATCNNNITELRAIKFPICDECIAGLALGRLRTQINETVDPELKKKRMENAWKTRRGK